MSRWRIANGKVREFSLKYFPEFHPSDSPDCLGSTEDLSNPEMTSKVSSYNKIEVPVSADLASLFECPVCFDHVLPPILQCQSGHLVCNTCRPKLIICPTCRGPLGKIPNLAMDKVASTVTFRCKFAIFGCNASLLHEAKVQHEVVCKYRPYVCPYPEASCDWQGSLGEVMDHLLTSHRSIVGHGENIVFVVTDPHCSGSRYWLMLQSCFNHNFILVLKKQQCYGHKLFFAIVLLIGSRSQAEHFVYRLELNGHRKRLTWKSTPRSIDRNPRIPRSQCLVFDASRRALQLFKNNGYLIINGAISMAS